jgi:hypothetical protein
MKKALIIGAVVIVVGLAVFFFWPGPDLTGTIIFPYIAHQKPQIDPHLPSSVPLSDKLDEVVFDGLFNVSANPSGITYEDGLAEFVEINEYNVVTLRLTTGRKWHDSYSLSVDEDEKVTVNEQEDVLFSPQDLNFTLGRIRRLGSLSPDYILVSQALERFEFSGPDENNEIRFKFKDDRDWKIDEIKEVLSFKILPAGSEMNASEYLNGTGPYITLRNSSEERIRFHQNPAGEANIADIMLKPYIDNSTFTTEMKNGKFNVLLRTPFGSLSPVLDDEDDFFFKSNISNTFFAIYFNTQRLNLEQRYELRKLLDNKTILDRFYKVGTEQARHIADYKGNRDNYGDYLNNSLFPSSTYFVEEQIVTPVKSTGTPNLAVLPDTIQIQACLNYGHREEYSELLEILNDPTLFGGRIRATAVQNETLKEGNYDAVLIAVSGYRSNLLFDLYDIFLREPDLAVHKIHLVTDSDGRGSRMVNMSTFQADKNFFRLDMANDAVENNNISKLLEYVYGFMSSREIGDRQVYARMIDGLEQEMALGSWLFSLPSLAYFSTQFDPSSIDLYGKASQLSTIEKWRETTK